MDLNYLGTELARAGWKSLQAGSHMGIGFDIVGSRTFLITQWNVLVKRVAILNIETTAFWRSTFDRMSSQSKSLIWGRCFILCLLADEIGTDVANMQDGFGVLGILRLEGGGGHSFVVDLKNRQVYGNVPTLPLDVHKFTKSIKGILTQGLAIPNNAPASWR